MARPIGSHNWVPQDIKQSIASVYHSLNGAQGLLKWAQRNQTEYYKMLVAILPKEQKIEFANPLMTISAGELAGLIDSIARARGIAVPGFVERIGTQETGNLLPLPKAETVS